MRPPLLLASILIAGSSLLALADDSATRIGAAAYGDWRSDAPGVRRKLTAADLPAPGASRSVANPSRVVARPEGALPKAPDGFAVSLFASGLDRAARRPRRAERRRLRRRERRRPRRRAQRRRRRGESGERRDLRRRAPSPVRHRLLSAGSRPALRLCRRDRPGRALPLPQRRDQGGGAGRDRRASAAGGPRPLDARPRLLGRRQDDVRLGRLGLQHRRGHARRAGRRTGRLRRRNTRSARPGARRRTAPTCSPSTPTAAACGCSRPACATAPA